MEAICRVTCATWPQGTNLPTPAMHCFMCCCSEAFSVDEVICIKGSMGIIQLGLDKKIT